MLHLTKVAYGCTSLADLTDRVARRAAVEGQMFMTTLAPNRYAIPSFYALHVWLWKSNPAGLFAPFNPNVSCAGAD